jgi:hypothetical protein
MSGWKTASFPKANPVFADFKVERRKPPSAFANMNTTANPAEYYRDILNGMPIPVFVVDDGLRFLDYNQTAAALVQADRNQVLQKRGGEALHCLNSTRSPRGCGHSRHCANCVIRKSVDSAISGNAARQQKIHMELLTPAGIVTKDMMVTTTPLKIAGQCRVLLILEDVTELLALREIIPICAGCKAIRDDQQYWQKLESYFHSHLHLDFSHGLCPECAQKYYPDLTAPNAPDGN